MTSREFALFLVALCVIAYLVHGKNKYSKQSQNNYNDWRKIREEFLEYKKNASENIDRLSKENKELRIENCLLKDKRDELETKLSSVDYTEFDSTK